MSSLRTVVYVSTAIAPMSEPELETLLIEARAFNQRTEITGVLLYADGSFMQCIEGGAAAVDLAYRRIRGSRKHTGLIELIDETVPERSFPDWQMGFAQASQSALLTLSAAQWRRQADAGVEPANESSGLLLLRQFWRRAGPGFGAID